MYVYEAHQPYSITFISFIHPLLPQVTPTLYLFYNPFVFTYQVSVQYLEEEGSHIDSKHYQSFTLPFGSFCTDSPVLSDSLRVQQMLHAGNWESPQGSFFFFLTP
jgi:hypothetical protein